MKDLTLSIVGVLVIALAIAMLFRWIYPLVTMSSELAGLFVFLAVLLKLLFSRLWALRRKPAVPPAAEGSK